MHLLNQCRLRNSSINELTNLKNNSNQSSKDRENTHLHYWRCFKFHHVNITHIDKEKSRRFQFDLQSMNHFALYRKLLGTNISSSLLLRINQNSQTATKTHEIHEVNKKRQPNKELHTRKTISLLRFTLNWSEERGLQLNIN